MAKVNEAQREQLYQYHISSVLCMISESAAKIAGNGSRYCTTDFYDIISKPKNAEKRTGQEIVDELATKMGLEVIANGIT